MTHILLKIVSVLTGGYVLKRLAEKRFGKITLPHYSHGHRDDDILSSV